MYAPKFRSWMTSWERFDEALNARLDWLELEAKQEITRMADDARAHFAPPKIELSYALLQALLARQYSPTQADIERQARYAQNAIPTHGDAQYAYDHYWYGGIGNALGAVTKA